MSKPIRILMVEDSEDDALLLLRELRQGGYDPTYRRVDTPAAMQDALEHETWDIVTADHSMPSFGSAAAMKMLQEKGCDVPFIIVSGTIPEKAAVEAMKVGASDYLIKGNLARFIPVVQREIREAEQRRERRKAEQALLAQQEQLRIAREIQEGLFPAPQITNEHYDLAGLSFPAEATGGDYFDYIPMPEDHLGIVVGDITGHGLGASLLMAEMRACLRALALSSNDVNKILDRANRLTKEDFGNERFVTMLFTRYSPRERSLVYLNAGHPSGYILDRNGAIRTELKSTCMPLGLHPLEGIPLPSSCTLEPGDLLLLLTDGVLDALGSEEGDPGTARVLDLVRANLDRPASYIADLLCRTACDAALPNSQEDDITAVVLKVKS